MLKEVRMPSVEERLSYVEGRVEEQSQGFGDLRRRIDQLDAKIDTGIARLDGRIDALDQKMSRQFFWLAGFQLTTLLAIVAALSR
jgi:hypothetical protein